MDRKKKTGMHRIFEILKRVKKLWKKDINVYFISGMCYNCSVFDKIVLPKGYKKKYIEWHVPISGQSLQEYASVMAKEIDTSRSYILIGYSFGGVIVQVMSYFLSPIKTVLISSFKRDEEIPMLFRAAKKQMWQTAFRCACMLQQSL